MKKQYPSKCFLLFIFVALAVQLSAQSTIKALFIGNSYTGVNNLPKLIKDVALSAGDTLIYDSNTPGGYTLEDHYNDATSTQKISSGNWNYVVLQEQSQRPITRTYKFNNFAGQLDKLTVQNHPCAVTMLYMTWGRKNGDPTQCGSFPIMCTYEGMDSTLRNNYLDVASTIQAEVSPVSVVWKYLRTNHPTIELYSGDGSHPSSAGSYAAACCFYAALFKKDPKQITFNYGLSAGVANTIRKAASTVVYDNNGLDAWDFKQLPTSHFWYSIGSGQNEIGMNHSNRTESYLWKFGDGNTSSDTRPIHSYASDGKYTIELTTSTCDLQGLHTSTSDSTVEFCSHTPTIQTPHSWVCREDTLRTQVADSYQWFENYKLLPENKSYIARPSQYEGGEFSVVATTNGCAERSVPFSFIPQWSGYYFDILQGDPCKGDTLPLAVLYARDTILTGHEVILWYKNDVQLISSNNNDTLLITDGGAYEVKVVNPTATKCPVDTTSFRIEYKCGSDTTAPKDTSTINWVETQSNAIKRVYPNPTSSSITVELSEVDSEELILLFNAYGRLVKSIEPKKAIPFTRIDIESLPNGIYFLALKSKPQTIHKIVKQ